MTPFRLSPTTHHEGRLVVTADRVLDPASDSLLSDAAVAMEGERIDAVGPLGEIGRPGDTVHAYPGHTVLPGLINSHVHLTISEYDIARPSQAHTDSEVERMLAASSRLAACLAAGVTTVRDVGASDRGIFALRAAVERGDLLGSRVFAAGALLCTTGGHAYRIGHQADGPDALRKAARTELKAGADFLKLMVDGGTSDRALDVAQPSMTDDEIAAVVEVAHRLGRRVTAHAIAPRTIASAVRAGVDAVEHGYGLDATTAEALRAANVTLVPTLSVHAAVLRQPASSLADVWWIDQVRRGRELSRAAVLSALDAGVTIAAGTDGGSPFNAHHDLVGELELLVEAGMSPVKAIVAATSVGAGLLDASDRIGSLRSGMLADLIAVPGDPSTDLSVLRRPSAVYLGGRLAVDAGVTNVAAH